MGDPFVEVHQQVASGVSGPVPCRMCGDAEDVHVPGADFHDQQDVASRMTKSRSSASLRAVLVGSGRSIFV